MTKYVKTNDVWPKLQELLGLPDLKIGGEVVIHLKVGDVVRCDLNGVMCCKPEEDDANQP